MRRSPPEKKDAIPTKANVGTTIGEKWKRIWRIYPNNAPENTPKNKVGAKTPPDPPEPIVNPVLIIFNKNMNERIEITLKLEPSGNIPFSNKFIGV